MTGTVRDRTNGPHVVPTERSVFRTWLASVTLGEFAGFLVPAVAGSLVMDRSTALVLTALVAAGAMEGTVLGWSQAGVLRRVLPALSSRRWVAGTAAAGALAWLLGMLPSTFSESWSSWPGALVVATGAVLGLALLCSIGVAQWLELRRVLPRAGAWVAATAGAWCAGLLAFTAVTSPLWHPGQSPWLIAAIGALGGLVMAVTMAALTGWALTRLLTRSGLSRSAVPPTAVGCHARQRRPAR